MRRRPIRNELRTTSIASAPTVVVDQLALPKSGDPRQWSQFGGDDRMGVLAMVCPATNVREQPWHQELTRRINWPVLPIFCEGEGANPSIEFMSRSPRTLNAVKRARCY
jgi:hypothetical protein